MKLLKSTIFILLAGSPLFAQYIPDPAFTADYYNRSGHSNSNLTNPAGAGGMQAPKCVVQSGDFVYAVGKTTTGNFDYAGYVLNKKDANTGVNVIIQKLDMGLLTSGGTTANGINLIVRSIAADLNSNRVYIVGTLATTPGKGIVLCFNTAGLTLDPTFNGNGIVYFEDASDVYDILVNSGNLITIRSVSNEIRVAVLSNSGGLNFSYTLNGGTYSLTPIRIKKYPGVTNRFYMTGYAISNTSVITPGLWGIDLVPGTLKGTVTAINLVCTNSWTSSSEGFGLYSDLCFPYNSNTSKYDIVCVGRTAVDIDYANGIYVKFKGNTYQGPPINLLTDNTFTNQTSVPGLGRSSTISNPSNMTVFEGCELIGDEILVVGSYNLGTHHDAVVGKINAAGTIYSFFYQAPTQSAHVVHYAGRFFRNASNQIFIVGCDYGLSVIKLKPN